MKIAGAAGGVVRATGLRAGSVSEEIRCPACSRLLVLRCGPAVAPHFAHRPRQSCRNRASRPAVAPLRLEQLTLFDVDALRPAPPVRRPRRRRRRAWLPRLVRWVKARAAR
jgi:hypothetical protein